MLTLSGYEGTFEFLSEGVGTYHLPPNTLEYGLVRSASACNPTQSKLHDLVFEPMCLVQHGGDKSPMKAEPTSPVEAPQGDHYSLLEHSCEFLDFWDTSEAGAGNAAAGHGEDVGVLAHKAK